MDIWVIPDNDALQRVLVHGDKYLADGILHANSLLIDALDDEGLRVSDAPETGTTDITNE